MDKEVADECSSARAYGERAAMVMGLCCGVPLAWTASEDEPELDRETFEAALERLSGEELEAMEPPYRKFQERR